MLKNNYKRLIIVICLFFSFQTSVDAASLWINSNKTENIKVGDIITAIIYVDAEKQSINNIEGELSTSNFEIQSVYSSDSILNMWVEQPNFSSKGITFNGGVLNPGFAGSMGKVLAVSLKASQEGTGTLSFNSASVRANDGLGTDVLRSKKGLSVTISSNISLPSNPPTPITSPVERELDNTIISSNSSLKAPVIHSSITPDPDIWYNIDRTTFTWDLPNGAIAFKTLLDSSPDSEPTILYDSVIKSRTISDIEDGIWYFHLKYKTSEGWSKAGHKKIKIDTNPPYVIDLKQEILDTGMVKANISARDKTSNITKIVISMPGGSDVEIKDISKDGEAEYVFPAIFEGLHDIHIKAFDEANNVFEKTFSINFPHVSIPKITTYPLEIEKNDKFVISGESIYPNSKVQLKIILPNGEIQTYTSNTKDNGNFNFEVSAFNIKGKLSALVEIFVGDIQIPVSSEKVYINIIGLNYITNAQNIFKILLVVVPSIILIVLLIVFLYFVYIRFINSRIGREREIRIKRIEKEITDLINSLKDLIIEDIHLIRADRNITNIEEAETILLKNLLKDFKDVEKRISNRIKRGRGVKNKIEIEEE